MEICIAMLLVVVCEVLWLHFQKILWRTYEQLVKKSDLRKTYVEHAIFKRKSYKNLMKNLGRSYAKLMINLRRLILRKRKIRGKCCHSRNPLTEAVIGRILWAKNNWQPEWRFPKNAFEKWLINFPKKILGRRISLTYKKNLWKSYDELRKYLTKILWNSKIGPLTSTRCCVRRTEYDSASSCGNERSQRQNVARTTERRATGVHHCTAERPAARHAQRTQGLTAETDNK